MNITAGFTVDTDWLVTAFVVSSGLRALFFFPQVWAVMRSRDGARDIVLSTWSVWGINNLLGALYAAVVVHHLALAVSFGVSALACGLTLVFTLRARYRLRKRCKGAELAACRWVSAPGR